jgi:hypothetical protein
MATSDPLCRRIANPASMIAVMARFDDLRRSVRSIFPPVRRVIICKLKGSTFDEYQDVARFSLTIIEFNSPALSLYAPTQH